MNKDETLWKDPAKKWKPRNKEAALICRKAKEIFLPPEEVVYTPNAVEQRALELKKAQERAIQIKAEAAEREKAKLEREKASREQAAAEKKSRPPKNMWLQRWLNRNRKDMTQEQIREARINSLKP